AGLLRQGGIINRKIEDSIGARARTDVRDQNFVVLREFLLRRNPHRIIAVILHIQQLINIARDRSGVHVEKGKALPAALLEHFEREVNGLGQHALEAEAGVQKVRLLQSVGVYLEKGWNRPPGRRNAIGGKILIDPYALQGARDEIEVGGIVKDSHAAADLG